MKKFEYKLLNFPTTIGKKAIKNLEDEMNRLGAEGWELVVHQNFLNIFIFKREL